MEGMPSVAVNGWRTMLHLLEGSCSGSIIGMHIARPAAMYTAILALASGPRVERRARSRAASARRQLPERGAAAVRGAAQAPAAQRGHRLQRVPGVRHALSPGPPASMLRAPTHELSQLSVPSSQPQCVRRQGPLLAV